MTPRLMIKRGTFGKHADSSLFERRGSRHLTLASLGLVPGRVVLGRFAPDCLSFTGVREVPWAPRLDQGLWCALMTRVRGLTGAKTSARVFRTWAFIDD